MLHRVITAIVWLLPLVAAPTGLSGANAWAAPPVFAPLTATATGATPPRTGATDQTSGAAAGADSHVSVPLVEYERLISRRSVTVVENLRVSGSFATRDLMMTLSGRSTGQLPRVEILTAPSGLWIYGCDGDAIVGRTGEAFEVVPLQPRFVVRCRLALSGSDRVQLDTTPSVLWVESQVSDGELVSTVSEGSQRHAQIVRVSGANSEVLPPSVTARYRITLAPDATQFSYQLTVWNPNRSHQPLSLQLRSGELVQKVDAAVRFEPTGNQYRFELPPGEQTIRLSGTLTGGATTTAHGTFRPPLAAAVHYLLLESHPLLRPAVTTEHVQRISPTETGLDVLLRGAQGFALRAGDSLTWQVLRLEAIHSTSFAIPSASHTYFLSGDGQVLGETALHIDNQGAPALTLPMQGTPSYASLHGEPVLLTQDENGHLWLPLSTGMQDVLVQHRQGLTRGAGFGVATLWLPEVPIAASHSSIQLRFGREWIPLYVELSPELHVPVLDLGWLLLLALLFVWTERLLAILSLRRPLRFPVAGLLSLAAVILSWWLVLHCLINLVISLVLAVPWLSRKGWSAWTAIGALCFGGVICLIGAGVLLTGRSMAPASDRPLQEQSAYSRSDLSGGVLHSKGKDAVATQFQGLPAKFTLPYGHGHSSFHRELLATTPPRPLYCIMISRVAAELFGALLWGAALLLMLAKRRLLHLGFVDIWERLHAPPPANK